VHGEGEADNSAADNGDVMGHGLSANRGAFGEG
jgi:hypothetical protein